MSSDVPSPLHQDHEAGLNETDPLLQSGLRRGKSSRFGDTPAALIACLGILALAGFTWALVLSNHPKSLGYFAFHPPLQTAAIVFFVFGILSLQRTTLDDPDGKRKGLVFHQYWIALFALPVITAGTWIMIYAKYSYGAHHFTSWHAKFGLLTWIWLILQALVGAGSVWFGGAAFGGGDNAKRVYKYHRISGYIVLTLLLVTVHLAGAWTDWVVARTTLVQRACVYTTLPAVILLSVAWRVRPYKMKFW